MKATGIVRRIDDLGRIVVPKEIRRTLRIREGDPLLTTLTNNVDNLETADLADSQQTQFVTNIVSIANRMGM